MFFYLLLSFILFSKYYDFKLTEAKGHLETMRGLFKTRKTNINLNRVQAILIKQNFLKRLFSIATVQLVIVSNSTEDDTEENVIIMPVINYEKVTDFLNQFFPNIPVEETIHFNPLTATYFYKFRNATIGMAITIGLIVLLLHRFVLLTTILSILGLLIWYLPAYLSAKRSNIQFLNDKYLQLQNNHLLTKQIALIPKASLQFTKKSQSLWLKRKNIANIALNIRSGVSQKTFAVTYQAENDIDSIMRWYKKTTNNQN
nr:PH domain-containing protein [Companilactobacillus halodurans]